MKIGPFILLFCIFCSTAIAVESSPQDSVEINLNSREVKLASFSFGDYEISGDFSFDLDESQGSLIIDLVGKNISFGDKFIPWAKAKIEKSSNLIFIKNLYIPGFGAKGNIDLEKGELSLDVYGSWQESSEFVEGLVNVKIKFWGDLDNPIASGVLVVTDGIYEGQSFSSFRVDFLGKPPLFNITDSEVVLIDGTVLTVDGILDIRDFSNLIPDAEFKPQKVYIDNWQLFSEEESIGLRKSMEGKVDVVLGANPEEEEQQRSPDTEVRYNLKDDQFLKLQMQEDQTIFKLEKRKDF